MREDTSLSTSGSRSSGLSIGLLITLVILLGVGGFLGWSLRSSNRQFQEAEVALTDRVAQLELELEAKEQDMQSLMETHRAELARINRDWEQRLADQMQREVDLRRNSLQAISKIVNESGSTLNYMSELEARVKEGKDLEEAEIAQMRAVANGLAYLHTQYQKPLTEFVELDTWLARQMQVETSPPAERKKFLKSMFNKQYREDHEAQLAAYYKDVGQAEMAEAARGQVQGAYNRAQADMQALQLSYDDYLENLNAIIETKDRNAANLDSFFEISKEILKIHQRVMDVKLEDPPSAPSTIKP